MKTTRKPEKQNQKTLGLNYYTPTQVAEELGVHKETIRREIRRGRIKALIIGGRMKISEQAVAAYVAENTSCGK